MFPPACRPQKFDPDDRAVKQDPVEYGVADVHPALLFLSCRPAGRESVPPETARLVPGTQGKATPNNCLISSGDGRAREVLRLARRAGDREAGNVRRMASDGVQDVLAMEVVQTRPSVATEKPPRTGLSDGPRKPDVGRGKDRK